jgi:hypothetical protein
MDRTLADLGDMRNACEILVRRMSKEITQGRQMRVRYRS